MNIFKEGKNFEIEAFGEIDKKKEKTLARKVFYDEELLIYFNTQHLDLAKRMLRNHPEIKEEIDKIVNERIVFNFIKKPHSYCYNDKVSLEIVKECQPRKKTALAKDLYLKVAEYLEIEDYDENQNPKNLKFYTAVNSKTDCPHGVDGFLTYYYKGQEFVVTLDITTNPEKYEIKADLLKCFDKDDIEKKENWKERVNEFAQDISKKFKEKIDHLNNN